jgi:hypothetical protein
LLLYNELTLSEIASVTLQLGIWVISLKKILINSYSV